MMRQEIKPMANQKKIKGIWVNYNDLPENKKEGVDKQLTNHPLCRFQLAGVQDLLQTINPRVMESKHNEFFWFHPDEVHFLNIRFHGKEEEST